jgi:hypothetical protein
LHAATQPVGKCRIRQANHIRVATWGLRTGFLQTVFTS